MADEFGVKVLSVKRWESDREPNQPPDDVWKWLLACREAMERDARELARAMVASLREAGGSEVVLDYHRTQEGLDAVQLGCGMDEPVGYFNARMRLVGSLLGEAGVPHTYAYPEGQA